MVVFRLQFHGLDGFMLEIVGISKWQNQIFFFIFATAGMVQPQLLAGMQRCAATTKMFSSHFYRGVMIKVKIYVQIREKRVSLVDFFFLCAKAIHCHEKVMRYCTLDAIFVCVFVCAVGDI